MLENYAENQPGRIPMVPQGFHAPDSGQGLSIQGVKYGAQPKPQSPAGSKSFKDMLKKAKSAFVGNKEKFAEESEEIKKIGEFLEKMNFDEDGESEESGDEGREEAREESDQSEAPKSSESMEEIQEILPQLDEEKLGMALQLLTAILEGKEPEMQMQEKKPMDQSRAEKAPNQNAPANFGESKPYRVPKWLEQQFGEIKSIKEDLKKELDAIKSEKQSKTDYAKFSEEVNVALKNNPQKEILEKSFLQTFSESGLVVARQAMKATLEATSKIPVAPSAPKMPRQLTESFSEARVQRDIPELKKYSNNPEQLKTAMKYAEIHSSRRDNTMSFGEYIDKGVLAEHPELRGDVRTKTFTETAK